MSDLDSVINLARESLIKPRRGGGCDVFLWDCTQRLVRNVEFICRLPELAQANPPIDHFCLMTASYFSNSGFARQLIGDAENINYSAADSNLLELLDFSTEVVVEKLHRLIDSSKIEKINRIITESGVNSTKLTEAMILSDARNLDDMGTVGVYNEIRRCIVKGRNIADMLRSWQKRKEYMYWHARLKEGFRFESVRRMAEERLHAAEHFMNQLRLENSTQDLRIHAADSAFV